MKSLPAGRQIARILILLLCSIAALNDFFSPSPAEEQDLNLFFAPPSRIHFVDAQGRWHLRPFTYHLELVNALDVVYEERLDSPSPVQFLCRGYNYRLLGLIPTSLHLACGKGFHPLGTDDLGRDLLARVLAGARTSLLIVLSGICLYAIIGLSIGALAGLFGGWVDSSLMRISEFVLALPVLYLILALRAVLPLRLTFWQTVMLTVGVIAGVAWPPMARGVRGLILQMRNSGYVEAARAIGCTRWRIFRRHILPALPSFVATQAAVAAPVFLLGEIVLSFLDVGFRDSGESWGSMLRNLTNPRVLTEFWWNLTPLVLVFATLLCLNLLSSQFQSREDAARI
jgi:peptide/nickel transport system permease protein